MYPGSVLHYKGKSCKSYIRRFSAIDYWPLSIEAIENVRGEDFDIRHNNDFDPFSYLGNGQLERETQEGSDLAFYIK